MSKRSILLKITFIFACFSIVLFGFALKQGLTALILFGILIALAGFLMKKK